MKAPSGVSSSALTTAWSGRYASRLPQRVQALSAAGAETFLEVGPGRALGGLVRQIVPGADVFSADSPARLDEFAAAHPDVVAA